MRDLIGMAARITTGLSECGYGATADCYPRGNHISTRLGREAGENPAQSRYGNQGLKADPGSPVADPDGGVSNLREKG